MTEEVKMSEVIDEVKNSSEEELHEVIKKWFESTRTSGMRIGAQYISAAIYGAIQKNLKNGKDSSLRDYQRAIKRIIEIVSVQLKQQKTRQSDSENSKEVSITAEKENET